jgi:hypothetical protein
MANRLRSAQAVFFSALTVEKPQPDQGVLL